MGARTQGRRKISISSKSKASRNRSFEGRKSWILLLGRPRLAKTKRFAFSEPGDLEISRVYVVKGLRSGTCNSICAWRPFTTVCQCLKVPDLPCMPA